MNKRIRVVTFASLMMLLVAVGSVSAVIAGQNPEYKADRMFGLAENAAEVVGELIDLVSGNLTALEKIESAGLTEDFEANISLYSDGVVNVTNAGVALDVEDYEGAIANATKALSIFREVYRSIRIILHQSEVRIEPIVDVDGLEESIDRSLERVEDLKTLISTEVSIYDKLTEAEAALELASGYLPDNIEDAKENLREANGLIGEVVRYLKQIAQELIPTRLSGYCEEAEQYRNRFRERFEQAQTEGFDVGGFLEGFGYQNEDEFMARFQEMIENAKETEDIGEAVDVAKEIGELIRNMGNNFEEEFGRHRARHGQEGTLSGNGQQNGAFDSDSKGFGGSK